jgi:PTS system ascorbate-specific IIB component
MFSMAFNHRVKEGYWNLVKNTRNGGEKVMKELKILVCCGMGLGSSFMVALNVQKVLEELNVKAEVEHSDLSSAKGMKADIYIGMRDIAEQLTSLGGEVISLNNIVDMTELKEKLSQAIASATTE